MNAHMKKLLEVSLRGLVALSIFTAFAVTVARAQNREEHFISARAGGVNFVSGDVRARRADEADWRRLTTKDELRSGDAARTGADGRVEVLLNPGSYFRAGEAAEFEMVDASLDDLRLRLSRGSAVVEAVGYDRLGIAIAIATPQARVHIIRGGIYRFSVLPSGVTEVAVQKGRALIGEGDLAQVVKGGQVASVGAGGVEMAKLDKNDRGALDQWSRDRGKELARLNEKLASRQMNSLLARNGFNGGLFPRGSSFGVWAFNPGLSCYTFLPFYYGWSSPYGYDYRSVLYTPPTYNGSYGGGSIGQGGYRPGGGSANPPGNTGSNPYPGGTGSTGAGPTPGYTPGPQPAPTTSRPSVEREPGLPRVKSVDPPR